MNKGKNMKTPSTTSTSATDLLPVILAIAAAFVKRNGAVQVQDAAGLEQALASLLADESMRAELGRNALKVVSENLGAIERTVNMIVAHLPKDEMYVAPSRHERLRATAQAPADTPGA